MDVFDLDRRLTHDYERFSRSFTRIRAPDIRASVDALYADRRFWPEPLISLNPYFEAGLDVAKLALEGVLHTHTAQIFRAGGRSHPIAPASGTSCRQSCNARQLRRDHRNGFRQIPLLFRADHRLGRPRPRSGRGGADAGHRHLPHERSG